MENIGLNLTFTGFYVNVKVFHANSAENTSIVRQKGNRTIDIMLKSKDVSFPRVKVRVNRRYVARTLKLNPLTPVNPINPWPGRGQPGPFPTLSLNN